jgi:O-methyltransferase
MKKLLKSTLHRFGIDVVRYSADSQFTTVFDLGEEKLAILKKARPFTMTSPARMAALVNAVDYISQNSIPGDIAECGVWRGGSMMTIALALLANKDTSRSLYLYDTFEGMSEPTGDDKSWNGVSAAEELARTPEKTGTWCYASIEDVRTNILSTGYPKNKIHLIKGKVEETIPKTLPSKLALLRLDTDWYESTRHELTHLYPLLQQKGILVIDDYGFWQGARKAVDEYFQHKIFLHRIDHTGRIHVKS